MREAEMAEQRKRQTDDTSDSVLDVQRDSVGTSGDSYRFVRRPMSGVYAHPKRSCRVRPGSKSSYGSLKTGTMSESTKPAQEESKGPQPLSNEPAAQSTSPGSRYGGSTLNLAFRPAPLR